MGALQINDAACFYATATRGASPELDQYELLTGNLEKIVEHGRRADGIVRSMLEHSRGATGSGAVTVDSQVGEFTEFTIRLPRMPVSAEAAS